MAINRYTFASKGRNTLGQGYVSKSNAGFKIYTGVQSGEIDYNVHTLVSGERLDYLAGRFYGDSSLWWVIAAASGIGYALQVQPGTILRIPTSLNSVFGVLVWL